MVSSLVHYSAGEVTEKREKSTILNVIESTFRDRPDTEQLFTTLQYT